MGHLVPFLDVKAAYAELKPDLDAAVARVLASGWYILGPEVDAFEDAFAAYCGAKHTVGVGNGLEALHLVLRAWDIGAGDEVIVPSNTYIATWLAVSMVGATPVPVEPIEGTMNLDPDRLSAAITPATRAVIPVHLYGQTVDMPAVMAVAKRHGLRVLEDAAQAHGATWRGRRAGTLGDAAAWSFYPGKNLGAFGDAGGVTTDDAALADRLRMLRNYGSRRKYYNDVRGYNSRLDPVQAAVLGAKLPKLDEWNARRSRVAATYLEALGDCETVTLPDVPGEAVPAWHLFVVRCRWRDALQSHLASAGVESLIHYPVPPHLSDAYRQLDGPDPALPAAERLAQTVLSLPIGPHLSDGDQRRVISAIRSFRPNC
jgi:dTDP-4-amino-4,6-dideoxygalactose transaminase